MKKFLMLLATTACLATACQPATPLASSNPNGATTPTGATGSVGGTASLATKTQFIAYMNCLKARPEVDAQSKASIDLTINAVTQIPDAQWALVSAGYSTFLQTYAKYAGC